MFVLLSVIALPLIFVHFCSKYKIRINLIKSHNSFVCCRPLLMEEKKDRPHWTGEISDSLGWTGDQSSPSPTERPQSACGYGPTDARHIRNYKQQSKDDFHNSCFTIPVPGLKWQSWTHHLISLQLLVHGLDDSVKREELKFSVTRADTDTQLQTCLAVIPYKWIRGHYLYSMCRVLSVLLILSAPDITVSLRL